MDRAEKVGLGIAVAGHVLLFGALSLGLLSRTPPVPPPPPAIDVSLVDKVALDATVPQSVTPPAQSKAPELGTPEDAPAKPAEESEPDPKPPAPQPKAAPPPKPAPAPPKPPEKPAVKKPDAAKAPPTREATTAAKPARAEAQAAGAGTRPGKRPRGGDLGAVMAGIGTQPTKSNSPVPQAATMSAQAAMDISSKIAQQVQPCANRQVKPGPGAERIRVVIHLKLRRDGTLIGNPEVVGYDGTDDDNSRYLDRVKDNAIATFKGCAPLRDLPQDLYDVPRGWSDFKMRYKLPG
ncbi:MAG: cell envelope biosis protein TolA [Sphingomonas bacterium]|uniref:cell envelope biogenesis protein TolA n=1 Tax=Sphingomonas bacterium TaxID=1895847 RepID=UPI002616D2A3|nr:cell envelope biogenesis protein TolA [Sphingomonas bacterium]MDB5709818.1 cell envelope biosis protein TolA [Sphingomonas bacterium]